MSRPSWKGGLILAAIGIGGVIVTGLYTAYILVVGLGDALFRH